MWDREREKVITTNTPGFILLPAARSVLTLQDDRDGVGPEAFSSGTQGFVLRCEGTEFIRTSVKGEIQQFFLIAQRHFPLSCGFTL